MENNHNKVLGNFGVLVLNSNIETPIKDIKDTIKDYERKYKDEGKTGLIVLVGNQCSLGITLENCDVVILLNDILSSDKIYQMMYRSMTEAQNKKCGFVVDLNINRVLNTVMEYSLYKKDLTTEDKIRYIVENNLIRIDSDYFMNKRIDNEGIVKNLLNVWKTDPINQLRRILKNIENDLVEVNNEDQKKLNSYFTKSLDENSNITVKFFEEGEEPDEPILPKGQKIIKESNSKSGDSSDSDTEKEDEKISLTKDVLPFLLPFICYLTIKDNNKNVLDMLLMIQQNEELLEIFNDQTFIWWNKNNMLDLINYLIKKYIKENSDIYNSTILIKMKLQSLIDQPVELLKFIHDCLKPKELEKKEFGEVFTPIPLINEMLDKLPFEVWENPDLKWLDPANGMGNFMIIVYFRLNEGLKAVIIDDKLRKKHILEKMLYMSEINKKNCFITKQIFDINNEYKLNIYNGDSLLLNTFTVWNIKNFDIIIGNPPYNKEFTKAGSLPLYNEFIDKFIDNCNILLFIIPSRWFSGGKGLDKFRKRMLERIDLVLINHFDDASKIFGNNVDIKGGVQYFMKDNKYNGLCNFNGVLTFLNKYDIFVENKYNNIIDYILHLESINKHYLGRYFGIESNDKNLSDNDKLIKCYVSQQKGFIKYIDIKNIKKDFNFWKVITSEASHKGSSGFGNIFIGKLDEIHTGSYISFQFNTEFEALSFESYLKCRLPNFFLSLRKISQHINENVCKWIPLPVLDRIWNDDEIYEYFKLNKEYIDLIKNTKIIGFKDNKDSESDDLESISSKSSSKSSSSTKSITKPKKHANEDIILCGFPLKKKGETCKNKANSECNGRCKRHTILVV
jgi:site-specific DNA-methyltransferase (adenine-specific)